MQPQPVIKFRPRQRICSGACPYFVEHYHDGRKVAGVGSCQRQLGGMDVRVGTRCAWERAAMGDRQMATVA
ncbi:MAG: hypothetical protein QOF51_2398, partial [Chloroflexota bacterium]|jgi:hypothetical protein|nr:hypothetical protein [Chloroflexota bacterium]